MRGRVDVEARKQEVCCDIVSPRLYIWLPKQDLDNDDANGHHGSREELWVSSTKNDYRQLSNAEIRRNSSPQGYYPVVFLISNEIIYILVTLYRLIRICMHTYVCMYIQMICHIYSEQKYINIYGVGSPWVYMLILLANE